MSYKKLHVTHATHVPASFLIKVNEINVSSLGRIELVRTTNISNANRFADYILSRTYEATIFERLSATTTAKKLLTYCFVMTSHVLGMASRHL